MPGTLKIIKHTFMITRNICILLCFQSFLFPKTLFFLTEVIQGAFKNIQELLWKIQGLFKDIPQFFNFQGHDAFLSPDFLRPHGNPVSRVNFCKDFRDCYTDTWDRENKLANSCLLTGESPVTIPRVFVKANWLQFPGSYF